MQRRPDSLDDCIEAIDAAVMAFGYSWTFLRPETKRIWIEHYAEEHAHPIYVEETEGKAE